MASLFERGGRLQRLVLKIMALLFAGRRHQDHDDGPRVVALLRFDRRLGEVLLQTPLFPALRAAFPDARLVAVTHPSMCRILDGQPDVDHVLPFSLRGFPFSLSSWRSILSLRRLRADVAIDWSK